MSNTETEEIDYLWIDFESDGTDPAKSHIIEAGVIATGSILENEFFTIDTMVIDGDVRETIESIENNPVLVKMHGDNGLLADLRLVESGEKDAITIEALDQHIYNLVKTHNRRNHKIILSGSGVGHYDHWVIKNKMPLITSLLQFYPRDIGQTRREFSSATGRDLIDINSHKNHRAFDDITDHLNETKAFRDYFVKAELALALMGVE